MNMSIKSIIGVYEAERDSQMGVPKIPVPRLGMNSNLFNQWTAVYQPKYAPALGELREKITHVNYETFRDALEITINDFKEKMPKNFKSVGFVQPGKSQKWVTEIAMQMGLKSSVYMCIGEEGANNLEYALEPISRKDKRFKHYVIIDDGSYSGNQMVNNITSANHILRGKFAVEPTFHVLVPYITTVARVKIEKLNRRKIKVNLHTAIEMPSISEAISMKNLKQVAEVLWPKQIPKKQQALAQTTALHWFDHKVPNSMSFPDVLATGAVTKPRKEGQENIPFIPTFEPPYKQLEIV